MKESIFKFILKFWYLFPILMIAILVVQVLLLLKPSSVYEDILFFISIPLTIAIPISWVLLIINKKYWKCVTSFLVSVPSYCIYFIAIGLICCFGPDTSTYGTDHQIPKGLKYNIPFEYRQDSCVTAKIDPKDKDTYLQVWNSFQGGIYEYDFYYGPLPAGEIYLKCFEVTENDQLSSSRLTDESTVKIKGNKSFSKLVDKQSFTIYEGVWDEYYAARIEVWYKNAETKEERKLMEKIYRVEGWER